MNNEIIWKDFFLDYDFNNEQNDFCETNIDKTIKIDVKKLEKDLGVSVETFLVVLVSMVRNRILRNDNVYFKIVKTDGEVFPYKFLRYHQGEKFKVYLKKVENSIQFLERQNTNEIEQYLDNIESTICLCSKETKIKTKEAIRISILDPMHINITINSILNDCVYYNKQFLKMLLNMINITKKNPYIECYDIRNISIAEEKHIIYRYNDNTCTFNKTFSILDYMENAFNRYNDLPAVESNGKVISYRQLRSRVYNYCGCLKKLGIKEGNVVAICFEKSIEMIEILLAITYAKAIVVPIDATLPEERLENIYQNSKPLLTISDMKDKAYMRFMENNGYRVIGIKDLDLMECGKCEVELETNKDNIAIILYTSGTTGKPKGILMTHQNIISSIINNYYINTKPSDRRLQVSNYIFDGFLFDLFSTIFYGACLVMLEHKNSGNPIEIAKEIKDKNISIVYLITPLLSALAEIDISCFDNLRRIYFGGEAASVVHVRKIYDYVGPGRLCNVYGPTETTMMSTVADIDENIYQNYDVPIGKAINNNTLYIMDQYMNLLPKNVPGEVIIGGYGVTRGYLNNKVETRKRYVYTKYDIGKVYRTGDLGYLDDMGKLHFMHRMDDQVKIRGFRIEIGDIENAICSYEVIKEAYVVVSKRYDTTYIVCYYTSGTELIIDKLKTYLKELIPEYMIPNRYYQVDNFPYTPTGKIDRRKLINEFESKFEQLNINIETENETESRLVEIVNEVFRFIPNSTETSLFEIGADSLSISILIAKIKRTFKVALSYGEVFRSKSIKNIAKLIDSGNNFNENVIKHFEKEKTYPLSNTQERIFTECISNKKTIGTSYNNLLRIEIIGRVSLEKLENAINKVVNKHRVLKCKFVVDENEVVQIIQNDYFVELEREVLCIEDLDKRIGEFCRPFRLLNSILFRCKVFEISNNQNYLVFDFHHTIFDGMSINVLLTDIINSYQGKKLEYLEYDYLDYCIWEKTTKSKLCNDRIRKFWKDKEEIVFNRSINLLNKNISQKHKYIGKRECVSLGKKTTDLIKKNAVENGVTSYMYLLGCYIITLFVLQENENIVVGTIASGRENFGCENIIGAFVETVPIIYKINKKADVLDVITNINEEIIASIENKVQLNELIELYQCANNFIATVFEYQNLGVKKLHCKEISMSSTATSINEGIKFPILIECFEKEKQIFFNFEYATNIFSKEDEVELIDSFLNVIHCINNNFDGTVEELQQIIKDFNKKESVKNEICK